MPGPQAHPIHVSEAQEHILQTLRRRHTSPQRLVRRCRIILAAAEGLGLTETAKHVGVSLSTVQIWRARWAETATQREVVEGEPDQLRRVIEATLADAPRSGGPLTFTAEVMTQVMAVACESPEHFGRPVTHWTPRELADEVIKQGIVDSISPRTVGRFLKRGRLETRS